MPSFKLVNPVVLGSVKTSYTATSPSNAAKMAWEALSEHMVNSNPKFAFTLKGGDGSLHSFLDKEKITGKNVDYTIDSLDIKANKKEEEGLLKQAEKVLQQGGADDKKKKDDSSSSSSESDSSTESVYERIRNLKNKNVVAPITYWWYYPYFYRTESYIESVYIPTFQLPIAPYVELHVGPLGSAAWA
jgi:hypothetical protein